MTNAKWTYYMLLGVLLYKYNMPNNIMHFFSGNGQTSDKICSSIVAFEIEMSEFCMPKFWKAPWFSRLIKIVLPIVILFVFYFESNQAIKSLDLGLLKKSFQQLAWSHLFIIFLVGIIAVSPMVLYDFVLRRHLEMKVSVKETIIYSWTANTVSNFIGFGGMAGMMIRTFFYGRHGHEKTKLLKGIGIITLFYLSGVSILSWFPLLGITKTPIFEQIRWIHVALIGMVLYFPLLLISIRKKKGADGEVRIHTKRIVELAMISILEWSFAFLFIFMISKFLGVSVSISGMFATFMVASFAGIISMLPGGIVSFDLMFLLGMQGLGASAETTLLILLLYRLSYFIIPAIIGLFTLLYYFWGEMNQKLNQIPATILQNTSHWIVTIFVLLSGLILLLSAAVPAALERFTVVNEILTLPIMNMSHQLTVGFGISLLLLTRGIQYRVKWAFHLTLVTLLGAAVFSLSKAFDYESAIFIGVVFILLLLSKKRFYRENFVPTWGKSLIDIIGLTVILVLFMLIGYVNLPTSIISVPAQMRPYVMTNSSDLVTSALIGLALAMLYMYIGYLFNKPRQFPFEVTSAYDREIKDHLEKYGGTVLSHLIFLHDKYIFWNELKTVMLVFQRYADKFVVLGDLVGEKQDILKAMEEFHDRANLYGYTPVYYQVTSEMFPFLHENGYDFFKLGEEAFVNLTDFDLAGKKMKNLRATKNKFEREGYSVQVLEPPHTDEFISRLKPISDDWLDDRKEKGFSLGWFDPEYVKRDAIAIVTDQDGQIVAFSNFMPVYDDGHMISVDLMRHSSNAPSSTMDYLFIKLFEKYKEENYQQFNLGMAPLANVGLSKYSFLTEKIAYQIFLYSNSMYSFKGLKRFKEKYADVWEPKYLALRKKASLPITMAQVTLLIARSGPAKKRWYEDFPKFF